MAFLRFSRDKRGYEHFYLVEATTNRRGKTRARVLYWFRTPPGVKVGREPFDPDVRRALELQNPDVRFDWRKIVETPIPSADVERWRERRRAEKAEKAARQALAQKTPDDPESQTDADEEALLQDVSLDAAERQADALAPTEESLVAESATIDPAIPVTITPVEGPQRRRRRRRGRGVRPAAQSFEPGPQPAPQAAGEPHGSTEVPASAEPGASGEPGEPREPPESSDPLEPEE